MTDSQQTVLELLRGLPLAAGIPPATVRRINELTEDQKLEDLIQVRNRANSAIFISRLPTTSPSEKTWLEEALLEHLKVPHREWVWFADDLTPLDPFQIDFKAKAQDTVVVLRELFKLTKPSADAVLVLSKYYYASPWCDETTSNIAREILEAVCIDTELSQRLVKTVQSDFKSLKTTKVSQAGFRKINRPITGLRPKLGFQFEDERHEWKKYRITSISTFAFLLSKLNSKTIKDHWWLVTPTILNVLDDHEGAIKLQGVKLLDRMLQIVDPAYFRMTGLESVFYDAVRPLLSYLPRLTPTPLSVQILSQTYPTLIKLFSFSDKYHSKLIELLNTGVFSTISTVRDNHDILFVLLQQVNIIIQELQIRTLKVLPRLLYSLSMVLSDPFIDTSPRLFSVGLDNLITLELNTWPRLKGHKYDILGLVAICHSRDTNDETMEKLRAVVGILENAVGKEELIDDYKELLLRDSSLETVFTTT